jgi:hypothetical protein
MEQGTLQFRVIEISGIFPRNLAGCACSGNAWQAPFSRQSCEHFW